MRSDPIEAARRLVGQRGRVLLHSAERGDAGGRYSFLSSQPLAVLEARGKELRRRGASGEIEWRGSGDALSHLESFIGEFSPRDVSLPGPMPVAIGYLGYDLALGLEPDEGRAPDLWFGIYGAVCRFDHELDRTEVLGFDDASRRRLSADLERAPAQSQALLLGELASDADDRERYTKSFERIIEYILAGDIYQANLARRLRAPVTRDGDALALYESVISASPVEYGALLEVDGARVLSASPERFLYRASGSRVIETRPIKGTRRRGTGDRALALELSSDPKERAEHLMIVDLERNDLGRVAEVGSVGVDGLFRVVELPALYHMVSTVSGTLRGDVGIEKILRATTPGGSITGAPKIRAMEVIEEVEAVRRGVYTGAIGYFGAGESMDFSIAIRTAVLQSGWLDLHVGGGIVADSVASREFEETEEKAARWRAAIAEYRAARARSAS